MNTDVRKVEESGVGGHVHPSPPCGAALSTVCDSVLVPYLLLNYLSYAINEKRTTKFEKEGPSLRKTIFGRSCPIFELENTQPCKRMLTKLSITRCIDIPTAKCVE